MIEGLTFGEGGYYYSDKSCDQEDAYTMEGNLIAPSPDGTSNALQELGNGKLADPDEKSIIDASRENQFGAYLAKVYLVRGEICALDIIGAVHKNNMDQPHARKQWYQTQSHDLVLLEQTPTPDLPPCQSREDDDYGESSTPPAEEQSRPIPSAGAGLRRSIVP